jgi:hypothetical protein
LIQRVGLEARRLQQREDVGQADAHGAVLLVFVEDRNGFWRRRIRHDLSSRPGDPLARLVDFSGQHVIHTIIADLT